MHHCLFGKVQILIFHINFDSNQTAHFFPRANDIRYVRFALITYRFTRLQRRLGHRPLKEGRNGECGGSWHLAHTALAGAKPGPSLWSGICLVLPGPPPATATLQVATHHRYRGYVTTQTNVTELIETERNHKKIVQYYQ